MTAQAFTRTPHACCANYKPRVRVVLQTLAHTRVITHRKRHVGLYSTYTHERVLPDQICRWTGEIKKIRFKSAKILVELRITLGITSSYARRTPRWARCTESAVTK